jgi:polysaccharide biosynthesis PFTS motif protein
MTFNIIKRRFIFKKLSSLRGAKLLRKQNKPYFVVNLANTLTEIPLGIEPNQFPKLLVGNHASKGEILLRQILLKRYQHICTAIMQSIGRNEPVVLGIPSAWINYLTENNINCSLFWSKVKLWITSIHQITSGLKLLLELFIHFTRTKYYFKPYVVFIGLTKNNLPNKRTGKSYDIISWYKTSYIKKDSKKEIWAQVKDANDSKIDSDIYVQNIIFPRLPKLNNYYKFIVNVLLSFSVSLFGVILGRWWYGFLFAESINLHYVELLQNEELADKYFFSNTSWYYKPLWAYEAEDKGSDVSLYCYSVNMEAIENDYGNHFKKDTYGLKIMTWNNVIVWNEHQMKFLKQFMPHANFSIVGAIDFSDSPVTFNLNKNYFNIAVFDVSAVRPCFYTEQLGMAIPGYYSDKISLDFLLDIESSINKQNTICFYKKKRTIAKILSSSASNKKIESIINRSYTNIEPKVAAKYLIECSDAVISLPYTSTGVIGKYCGKPSIYYDPSSELRTIEYHGIPVLRNIIELKDWLELINNK